MNHTDQRAGFILGRDADGPVRTAVEVVHRPVERVDHPSDAGERELQGAFLADQSVLGTGRGQAIGDQLLGSAIGGGDGITGRTLGLDSRSVDAEGGLPGQ